MLPLSHLMTGSFKNELDMVEGGFKFCLAISPKIFCEMKIDRFMH
jgi:hypothetical protein